MGETPVLPESQIEAGHYVGGGGENQASSTQAKNQPLSGVARDQSESKTPRVDL